MKVRFFGMAVLLGAWIPAAAAFPAAAPSASLLKAKQEAEAKGFVFYTSFDEIVAQAKKEGRLRILSGEDSGVIKATAEAFKKKYPFIDARPEGVEGTEVYLRMLSEMKAGLAKWDVNYLAPDYYPEYLPFQKKFDFLGMAQNGVLNVPPRLVDPVNRHIVALQSNAQIVAYNKELISGEKVPNSWEDFLKPEFKERKFASDIRPKVFASLVPAWGSRKHWNSPKNWGSRNPSGCAATRRSLLT